MDDGDSEHVCVCVFPLLRAKLFSIHAFFNPSAIRAAFPNLCKNNEKNKRFFLAPYHTNLE